MPPATRGKPGPFTVFEESTADVRRLLTGNGRGQRLREFTLLAAMAGIVGVGAAPPPLGLLHPFWEVKALRDTVSGTPLVVGLGIGLALFLLVMAAVSRSFTFAFLEGLREGAPHTGHFRRYLVPGVTHFLWSSALSLPLYAILFLGEWWVTRDAGKNLNRLLDPETVGNATTADVLMAVLGPLLGFMLVLAPWTLLTLPVMVWIYELTPAAMFQHGCGPVEGGRRAWQGLSRLPGGPGGYLLARLVLQFLGNFYALVALVPALLGAAVAAVPLMGLGYGAAALAGGPQTGPGVAALTVTSLLSVIVLYVFLCACVLPVSLLLNGAALRAAGGHAPSVRSGQVSDDAALAVG